MSVSVPTPSLDTCAAAPSPATSASEVDASNAIPLYGIFMAGIGWLVLGSILGLIASVKLHAPALLSQFPALTYGRLIPAQNTIFLYGFAMQIGLGIAIWIISRLGRTKIVGSFAWGIGALLWNVGVFIGFISILSGDWTGLNRFEMPAATATPLFVGYLLFGIVALLTFKARTVRDLYPSMWFILASIFWFPWIYATASYLLHSGFLRSSAIPVISGWYGHNFVSVVLLNLALGASYYFIPKLSHRPLASEGLAIFGFWSLLVVAPFGGFAATYAVPRWVIGMSVVSSVLCLLPILAHSLNWYQTVRQAGKSPKPDQGIGYFLWAGFCFALFGILAAWAALPTNNLIVGFTWFQTGLTQLLEYGFIGLVLLGALTVVVPKLTQLDWPIHRLVKPHYLLTVIGILLMTLPVLMGGWIQGTGLADASVPFMVASKKAFPWIAMSTVGILLFTLAQIALFVHLVVMLGKAFINCCHPASWMGCDKGGAR